MTPLEAMYFGKPVIVLNQGGFKDTVIDNYNGVFINQPTAESVAEATCKFEKIENSIDWNKNCRETAKNFTKDRFKKEFKSWLDRTDCVANFSWSYADGGKALEIASVDYMVYRKEAPSEKTLKTILADGTK